MAVEQNPHYHTHYSEELVNRIREQYNDFLSEKELPVNH